MHRLLTPTAQIVCVPRVRTACVESPNIRIGLQVATEVGGQLTPSDVFIGRVSELDALNQLLDEDQRVVSAALIQGEAGIGKTRLVTEFLKRAQEKGFRVARGSCYQVREAGPYSPFVDILRQMEPAASGPGDAFQSQIDKFFGSTRLAASPEELAGNRTWFLRHLTDAIFEKAKSEVTIVSIEDLQWADIGSLLLLNKLLDVQECTLRIVCTARDDGQMPADVAQLIARIEGKTHRISLKGLDVDESRRLVHAIAGPGRMTDEEVGALWSFTKGNPLFLRELLLHLETAGWLESDTVQGALMHLTTPRSLVRVIESRLRSVPRRSFRMLAAAAVIGEQFSTELVSHALATSEDAVEAKLQTAVDACLIEPLRAAGSRLWKFTHPLFASRLYETLSQPTLRTYHRRLAEAMTSAMPNLFPVEEAARHFALGYGKHGGGRAVELCRAAAERADELTAYETAARFWELALRCVPQTDRRRRAELLNQLGRSLWAASKWTAAAKPWKESLRLFQSVGDRKMVGTLALALGDMYRWRQELSTSEKWLKLALDATLDSRQRARALALMASIHSLRSESKESLELLEEASRLSEEMEKDPFVGFWLAFGFLMSGDRARSYETAKEALIWAKRNQSHEAIALLAGSLVHHELANLNLSHAKEYVRVLQQNAHDSAQGRVLVYLFIGDALTEAYAGNWRTVELLCERWLPQLRLASAYHQATARVVLAEARLALGKPADARDELLEALPDLEQMRPAAGLHLARTLQCLDEVEEACSLVRQFADRTRVGQALLGDVASRLPLDDLWRPCYDRLAGESSPLISVYVPVSVQRVLGRLATKLQDWGQAERHFETAAEQLAAGAARWELAQTYLDYAEMRRARRRRGDATKAAALDSKANAIFGELGITRPATKPLAPHEDGNRFGLTGREVEVLNLVAEGRRNQEIAGILTLSPRTVERHVENILNKMGAGSRMEVVMQAVATGLIDSLTTQRGSSRSKVPEQAG